MDKTKILIIGENPQSRWMEEALSRHPALFDVEVRPFSVGTVGHKPEVFVIDDLLAQDYSALEDHVFANLVRDGWAGKQVLFNGAHITVSAVEVRQMYKESMVTYLGQPDKPADHPTRKREPKGPRGKWGKLK